MDTEFEDRYWQLGPIRGCVDLSRELAKEYLMTEYEAPSAEVAAFVHRKNAECEAQRERLSDATSEEAWSIATDTAESVAARLEAILVLVRARDSRVPELVLSLFDESDLTVWCSVIRSIHPDRPEIRERLRTFARDCQDERAAAEALCVLAQVKDVSTISICRDWLSRNQSLRNAAVEALRMEGSDESVQVLKERWTRTDLTNEDRNTLALVLTRFGDHDASHHTLCLAKSASDSWSVAAATSLYLCTPATGLRCMLDILSDGTLAAKQAMVSQVSSLAGHLPYEFTADGIHEARLWVETELATAG